MRSKDPSPKDPKTNTDHGKRQTGLKLSRVLLAQGLIEIYTSTSVV